MENRRKKVQAHVKPPRKNNTSTKKATPIKTEKDAILYREIWGVVMIAMGLVLAVILYFAVSTPVGKVTSNIIFGLIGFLSFISPLVLIACGILSIISRKGRRVDKTIIWICVCLFAIITLVDLNCKHLNELNNPSFGFYCKSAYTLSALHSGFGGFIGSLLAYPLKSLVGIACGNIILIALMLICILIITRISIKQLFAALHFPTHNASKKVADTIDDDDVFFTDIPAPKLSKVQSPDKCDSSSFLDNYMSRQDPEPTSVNTDVLDPDFDFLESQHARKQKRPLNVEQRIEDEESARFNPNVAPADRELFQPIKSELARKNLEIADECIVAVSSENGGFQNEYQRPPYTLLEYPIAGRANGENPEQKAKKLLAALQSFNINAQITNISVGPTITRFEVLPPQGVRVRRITELGDDLALALAAGKGLRFEAPIPGKSVIGIEVPNQSIATVYLREVLESKEFQSSRAPLTIALGKDATGKIAIADLSKMPHLLIAGRTGSGKSVCLNTILLSLIYRLSPEELRLILVDPKVVEFRSYSNLPHLLVPVVTEHKKAASSLHWAVSEMERRNKELAKAGARNIARYNQLQENPDDRMPRIVIIIDELADLMMTSPKEVEDSIVRLSQLGRASGIHLIVATQRPSADIITPIIKANVAARIAFVVTDATNSRVILDMSGAEHLVGNGDMLFHTAELPKPVRMQCAFVSDDEVEKVAEFFQRTQPNVSFDTSIDSQISAGIGAVGSSSASSDNDFDANNETYIEAIRLLIETKRASASFIQQRLHVGFNRAACIINDMEEQGIVSKLEGSRGRKVLMTVEQFNRMYGGDRPIIIDTGDDT